MRAGDKVHVEFDAVATGPDHIGSSLESVPIIRCSYLTNQFGATVTVIEPELKQGDIARLRDRIVVIVCPGLAQAGLGTYRVRFADDDSSGSALAKDLRRVDIPN